MEKSVSFYTAACLAADAVYANGHALAVSLCSDGWLTSKIRFGGYAVELFAQAGWHVMRGGAYLASWVLLLGKCMLFPIAWVLLISLWFAMVFTLAPVLMIAGLSWKHVKYVFRGLLLALVVWIWCKFGLSSLVSSYGKWSEDGLEWRPPEIPLPEGGSKTFSSMTDACHDLEERAAARAEEFRKTALGKVSSWFGGTASPAPAKGAPAQK